MNTRYYQVKGSWWADTTIPTATGEVQLRTYPSGGGCKTMAAEWNRYEDEDGGGFVTKPSGWDYAFGYHPAPKATKRNVTEHHELSIARLKTIRPELFSATQAAIQ